jgi:iron complex outermembrane receptor protein
MPSSFLVKTPLALAITTLLSQSAFGQSNTNNLILEEVQVTAQKRVESLQDVPLSVAAVSGEKLEEAGIENLEDLTSLIPNIHLTETGISTQLRVRGIGSDNSQGFEQSVGMYIDGIYHGRAQLFRAPFFDLERAEVLRGPQGTLFGKNSIAGALNLTTAKPTEDFQGKVSASYEFENEQQEINAVVSGPLTDTLNGRLALRTYEDAGYIENHYTGETDAEQEEKAVRASLDWAPTDKLNILLTAEESRFDVYGRQFEISLDEPNENTGLTYGQYLQLLSALGPDNYESELNYVRHTNAPEVSENEVSKLTLTADYKMGANTLTLVSGWLGYDYFEQCDCDYTAANVFSVDLEEDYEQFSQEIRLTSPGGETVDWLAGAFYQEYDQTYSDQFFINSTSVLIPAIGTKIDRLNSDQNPDGSLNTANDIPAYFDASLLANTGDLKDFEQSSEAWAVFAQATWNITERWHLTGGGRYTQEDKSAHKTMNIFDITTGDIISNTILGEMYAHSELFRAETEQGPGHDISGSRSEKKFTPLVTVEYDLDADTMLYGSFTKGFKAGGFDPRSNNEASFEFEEESATAYEFGLKSSLAGGRGEINAALYRTDYDDLQISQFDGAVGFNVGNAKETRVQGIEMDGRWLFNENFSASYGLAWLDFEYLDFQNGNCYADQPGATDSDGNPSTPPTCDYTGKEGVYTPDYTTNLTLDYNQPLDNGWMVLGALDIQHVAEQQVHTNLDPKGMIDSQTMVSLRLALDAESWTIALLGKNLLDEDTISYSANAPLSDSSFDTNTHYSFVKRPRTIALEGTYRF